MNSWSFRADEMMPSSFSFVIDWLDCLLSSCLRLIKRKIIIKKSRPAGSGTNL